MTVKAALTKIFDEDTLASPEELIAALDTAGFVIVPKAAKRYECPVCATSDPNLYTICNRGDCPDGRDPR